MYHRFGILGCQSRFPGVECVRRMFSTHSSKLLRREVLRDRAILRISGEESRTFLQGLVTNDMSTISSPNQALFATFLNTKGRVLFDAHIVIPATGEQDAFFLDIPKSKAPEALKHLKRYKLRSKVQIAEENELSSVWLLPEEYEDKLQDLNQSLDHWDLSSVSEKYSADGSCVYNDARHPYFGVRGILPSSAATHQPSGMQERTNLENSLFSTSATSYEIHRVLGACAEGTELSGRVAHECNIDLLNGINFHKGCYLGQELMARTQFKGNVRKRLLPVVINSGANSGEDAAETSFDAQVPYPVTGSLASALLKADSSEHLCRLAEVEATVVSESTKKRAGNIVHTVKGTNLGLAMMRLEHVLPGAGGAQPPMRFSVEEGQSFRVLPLRPLWWLALDSQTGKPHSKDP